MEKLLAAAIYTHTKIGKIEDCIDNMISTLLIIFGILFVASLIISGLVDKEKYDKPPLIPLVSPFAICLENFFEEIYINPLGFTVHFADIYIAQIG